MEHALFLRDRGRAVWVGFNIGYLFHFDKNVGVVEWWKKLINLRNNAHLEEETDHVSLVLSTYGGSCGRLETISSLQGNGSNQIR